MNCIGHAHHFTHVVLTAKGEIINSRKSPYGPLLRESNALHCHKAPNSMGLILGSEHVTWEVYWCSREHLSAIHNPPEKEDA